jgi:tetratricopeptide (TPR) repeat protein
MSRRRRPGTSRSTLAVHTETISSIVFSPDGKSLIWGSADRTARVWDVAANQPRLKLAAHAGNVECVAFAPDNKRVATGSWDGTVGLWDVAPPRLLTRLNSRAGGHSAVKFSPDGRILAAASGDTIKLWDTTAYTELATLDGHQSVVWSLVFTADGKTLVSGGWDKTIRIWDVAKRAELRVLPSIAAPAPAASPGLSSENLPIATAKLRGEAEALAKKGEWAQAIRHLDRLILQDPGDYPDRLRRAEAHARLGHWSRAAADYAKLLELQPQLAFLWFEHACVLCQLEDLAGYQKLCSRMHERFGQSQVLDDVLFATHSYVLAPGALADPAELVKWAKQRLAMTAPPSDHNAYSVHVLGLAYYRAGDFDAAVECLSKDPSPKGFETEGVLNWLVLALAEHKRDRAAEARKWLARADLWLANQYRNLPQRAVVPADWADWRWRGWVLVLTLHREAKRSLAGKL